MIFVEMVLFSPVIFIGWLWRATKAWFYVGEELYWFTSQKSK